MYEVPTSWTERQYFDIKPYVAYADSHPDALSGFPGRGNI